MALTLITNPPTSLTTDTDWTTFVSRSGYGMIGHGLNISIFTLTEWESGALIPEIAQGSIINVGTSYYQADSDTALTADTGLVDGTVRIKLVPAGGGATVTPTITSDALPAWNAEKGGWYDSDDKFLPHVMTKSGTSYTGKGVFVDQNASIQYFIDGAAEFDGNMTVGGSLDVDSGASFGGALSVGAGASFSGALSGVTSISMSSALSGVTSITASGDISCDDVTCNSIYSGSSSVKLKWKRLTGTLSSSYSTVIPHGITGTIFGVVGYGQSTIGSNFQFGGSDDINAWWTGVNWTSSDIILRTSSVLYSGSYDILVHYV